MMTMTITVMPMMIVYQSTQIGEMCIFCPEIKFCRKYALLWRNGFCHEICTFDFYSDIQDTRFFSDN